jgi:Flp pilus assembly protein TadG
MSSQDPLPLKERLSRRLRRGLLRRFRKNKDGVTAIEFGLVAMPFFTILFAILEVSLAFWVTQVLETMVADAARQVYTGQFQQANAGKNANELKTAFKTLVCSNSAGLFDCQGKLEIDVRRYQSFPGPITSPINASRQMDTNGWGYEDSKATQIVVVRAAMEYPIFLSLLNPGTLASGNRLIMATATFRNEPFQ